MYKQQGSGNHRSIRIAALSLVLASASVASTTAMAASDRGADQIYTCVTANGQGLTSDRVIDECHNREQRVKTRDGVLLRVVPPQLFGAEKAAYEEQRAKQLADREAKAEAERKDLTLLSRYSTPAAHERARTASLRHIVNANRNSKARLAEIEKERVPLAREAEFYKKGGMPAKLKQQLEELDATEAVVRSALKVQAEESERINGLYDLELARLKRLWAGAKPGSLDAMTVSTRR
jgi:hypothetical protein